MSGPKWSYRTGTAHANDGWYAASTTQFNASSLKYLKISGTGGYLYGSSSSSAYVSVTFYVSIASSRSNVISSDSGVGASSNTINLYTTNLGSSLYTRSSFTVNVNLTSCTRTGYLKIGFIASSRSGGSWSSDDYGGCYINNITYYDSSQSATVTCTVT